MPTVVHSLAATSRAQRQVRVELGARSYEVLIGPGLLDEAGRSIAGRIGKAKCAIVTDENVAGHHLATLEASLRAEGQLAGSIILPAGESTKSFGELAGLCERLLSMKLERGDVVVALGGGVIGDIAGFAAGILRRGVRLVQVPTSLLAQVDSSVGGKTGINTPQGKNLIGVFHQPILVLADTDTLQTLPPRELRAGYAEVVKYGLLGDAEFFAWLEKTYAVIFGFDADALATAIERSVRAKAGIVARDEFETGERALLNLGHTFGHALEAWSGYSDRLLHGEAVAIGICMAFRLSEQLGFAPAETAARVGAHFGEARLPTTIAEIPGEEANADRLMTMMAQDKKVRGGRPALVLARGIGEAFVTQDVAAERVRDFLQSEIARH